MSASVIVATYNRPRELQLCLLGLARQSVLPDEVLIADDGSAEETRRTIFDFAGSGRCPFPVRHVWQENLGFRKPRILNETVRNASGDHLIFIDGDCMAHPAFVRSHLDSAEPDAILGGKRVDVGRALSARTLSRGVPLTRLSVGLVWDSIVDGSRKVEEAIRIRPTLLRRLFRRDEIPLDGIWGCNFSIPKALFYAVNGCDEEFLDGSIEDNDLGVRVSNAGGRIKSVRALAVVFHLWHPPTWGVHEANYRHNRRIMEKRIALRETRCARGIDGEAGGPVSRPVP